MRPVELVTPVLPERPLVVHALLGPVDSRPYFAGLVEAEHREVDAAGLAAAAAPLAPAESLLVVVVDDDVDLPAVLGALDEGAHAALLFKVSPDDLPWARVLNACSVRDLQVVRVGALSYDAIRAGVVVTRSTALRLPATADLAWSEQRNAPVSDATLRRLLNEFVILDLDHRFGAEHRRELEHELREARAALGPTPVNEQLAALREQLEAADERRRAAEKRARIADAAALRDRKQLVAVENSAKYVVGGAIVTVLTRPQRIVRVAKDLRRWWRRRKSGTYLAQAKAAAAAVESIATPSAPAAATDPRVGWGGVAGRRTDGPVVLAVVSEQGRALFEHDCDLRLATPTADIAALFGEVPDLVLVQASAGRPGQPWAGAGRAGEVARTRQVCALLDAARAAGVPAVVWRDTEPGELPGWASIAPRAERAVAETPTDLEAPWHPGGSLLRARRARLAAIAHGTPPSPVLRITGADSDPDALAGALATAQVAVLESSATQAQLVQAFLSGAGLVAAPGVTVPAPLARFVNVAPGDAELDATVDAALERGRYTAAQVCEAAAEVMGEVSTRARLEALALPEGAEPAGSRTPVAVLAHLRSAVDATRLATGVVGARVRPEQLVVAVDDSAAGAVDATRALDEIAAAGIPVRRSPESSWSELARRAEWDRVLPWTAPAGTEAGVVDRLALALESSGAAVVAVPRAGGGHDVLTTRSLLIAGPLPDDPVGAWRWAGVHVDEVTDIVTDGSAA